MSPTSPASLFDLHGRVALVTGASRGIGEAIAHGLAAQGAHVIVSSRKAEACEAVAAAIRAAGGSAQAMACHIGDLDAIAQLYARIDPEHARLDIVVNNAATNPHYGPIWETDAAAFAKTVDVNIRGYFFMCAQAVQRMRGSGGGAIVNVASVNGVRPGALQGIYSVTKAAVIAMTEAFAKECAADGVRVNALLPGLTDTRFAQTLIANRDVLAAALRQIPLGRVARPDEMVGAVLYLASPAASYTTGVCLPVDGGYLIG